MTLDLDIQYRGDLSSCNYSCDYCPFAKTTDTSATLAADAAALDRFVSWISDRRGSFRILFTPWGEALIRRAYRDAVVRLSHLPQVRSVSAQTNLSGPLDFLRECRRDAVSLWCTYHPSQTTEGAFLDRCSELDDLGVAYSVGTVGLEEDLAAIEQLRAKLPPGVYVWVNAYKRVEDYYSSADVERLEAVDPLFRINLEKHPSRGRACRAGTSAISVDARGDVRRCHFVPERIGNLYDGTFERSLRPSVCPNETCGCYIGYIALEHLGLERVYGDGLLARIPRGPVSLQDSAAAGAVPSACNSDRSRDAACSASGVNARDRSESHALDELPR